MSVSRMFPVPEVDDLKNVQLTFASVSSYPGCESFAIVGENAPLRSSLLFQAAISYARDGDQVIFIRPGPFKPLPFPVQGMQPRSSLILDCIKMVYITEPLGLIRYLCEFHMMGIYPSAIIVEDIQFYVSHHQEQNRDAAVFKLFALLEDTTSFVSQKRNIPCHRMVSLSRSPSPPGSVKRYFQEVWHLSFSENKSDIFLTDDHIPAYRIVFHVEDNERIVFDKLIRLPALESC